MNIISLRPLRDPNRPERVFTGLGANARSLAFSPDGGHLAAVVGQNVVCWRLSDGQVHFTAPAPPSQSFQLALSMNGHKLCTMGSDTYGEVEHVYLRTASGTREIPIPTELCIRQLQFSPDSACLTLTSMTGAAFLIDTNCYRPVSWLDHASQESLTMSADGHILASIGGDNVARLWELGRQQQIAGIELTRGMDALALSSNARFLAVGSRPLLVWDTKRGRAAKLSDDLDSPRLFSPDEHVLVATRLIGGTYCSYSDDDPWSESWEAYKPLAWRFDTAWRPIPLAGDFSSESEPNLAVSRDSRRLMYLGDTEQAVWDLETGEVIYAHGEDDPGRAVESFDADGRRGLTIESGAARVMVLETEQAVSVHASAGSVTTALFSPDNALLAVASDQGSIDLWRVV